MRVEYITRRGGLYDDYAYNLLLTHGGAADQILATFIDRLRTSDPYKYINLLEDILYGYGFANVLRQIRWVATYHPENVQLMDQLVNTGQEADLEAIYPNDESLQFL